MMAFKTLFRYGVPVSFVYCTVYQQDIWREGDEHLFQEQKRVWRDFFNLIDNGYQTTVSKLKLSPGPQSTSKGQSFVSTLDSLDIKAAWNNKVQNTFTFVDQVISNPKATTCKIYRKIQPYVSSPPAIKTKTNSEISELTKQ